MILLTVVCLLVSFHVFCEVNPCPGGFILNRDNLCVHSKLTMMSYCSAQLYCSERGRDVSRVGFLASNGLSPFAGSQCTRCWTGLHRLFIGPLENPHKWYFTDPNRLNQYKIITIADMFGITRHGDGKIVIVANGRLERVHQRNGQYLRTAQPLCQVSSHEQFGKPRNAQVFKLLKRDDPLMDSTSSMGCTEVSKTNTHLLCAMRCKLQPDCVTFYFHPTTHECVLSQFVDSKLPRNKERSKTGWNFFVKSRV